MKALVLAVFIPSEKVSVFTLSAHVVILCSSQAVQSKIFPQIRLPSILGVKVTKYTGISKLLSLGYREEFAV